MYWLGIDIGTGGSRALLIDAKGKVVASHTSSHEEMTMLRPLWAEQQPEDWWRAAQKAIKGVLHESGATAADVLGIGLSGQMHGLTLLDENDDVIRPALIWCDQRSQAQVDSINSTVGRDKVLQFTANPVVTGFTLPKLLWVRDNEPANFERVRKVLLPKDYVRFRLTGEYATEVSDASGTSLFDVVARRWSFPNVRCARTRQRHLAYLPRIAGSKRTPFASGSGRAGTCTGNASRRRRRRSSCQCRRQRHRSIRHRILHAWHLRSGIRPYGQAGLRPARPSPHLLPRSPRKMARDGRNAGRGAQPPMVPQPTGT